MAQRGRRRLVAAIVALQLVVPAVALLDDPPARFGWQMFARSTPPPTGEVRFADGRTVEVDVLFGNYRPEVAYHPFVVEHLCDRHPSALSVRVIDGSGRRRPSQPC